MSFFDSLFGRNRKPQAAQPQPIHLDPVGQPPPALNLEVRMARDINEILGVLRGLCADGYLSNEEILFLGKWMLVNREFANIWPMSILTGKLAETVEAWPPNAAARAELHALINKINGSEEPQVDANTPTTLPLTQPPPAIVFAGREFVLTGTFIHATRRECQAEIETRGGTCARTVSRQTHYLVIGEYSSRDWVTSSWGRKIERAASYAEKYGLVIVSESHWVEELSRHPLPSAEANRG